MFFFFKQKTAYEMRISDWSSDVCSSDLGDEIEGAGCEGTDADLLLQKIELIAVIGPTVTPEDRKAPLVVELIGKADARLPRTLERLPLGPRRSEEHTSELQSLMRISYAVFCLKKKKKTKNTQVKNTQ